MQTKYLLLIVFVFVLGSCSTAYRTGQTPDDVYYSPEPTNDEYVNQNNQDDRDSYGYRNSEENQIRQGIRNPRLRNSVSIGIGMGYDPYNSFGYAPSYGSPYGYNSFGYSPYYGNSYGYNSFGYKDFYNPYSYNYNNFYSPYPYYGGYYGNSYNGYYGNNYGYNDYYYPGIGTVNSNRGVRRMNGVSNSYGTNRRNSNGYTPAPERTFPTQQRPSSGVGNAIRRVFNPGSNNSNSRSNSRSSNTRTFNNSRTTQSTPTRDFNSSSNSGSSSSGSNSGSAPARVFRK